MIIPALLSLALTTPTEVYCEKGEKEYLAMIVDDSKVGYVARLKCVADGDVVINTRDVPDKRYKLDMDLGELFEEGEECSAGHLHRDPPEGHPAGTVYWREGRYKKDVNSGMELIKDSFEACREAENPGT